METTLFFQGPVRTGKSTRLRRILAPFSRDLGGFVVIRLLDDQETPYAYQLMDVEETTTENFPVVERPFTGREDNIFLYPGSGRFLPEVFETVGMELLEKSRNKKMILLDEIGGLELTCPDFRQALIATLTGPVPCIGVFKEQAKAKQAASLQEGLRTKIRIVEDPGEPAFSRFVHEFLEYAAFLP